MNRMQMRASKANGRKMIKLGWNEFQDVTKQFCAIAASHGVIRGPSFRGYKNNLYTVQMFPRDSQWGVVTLMMIRRNDEAPIRDWSHMQRIKNELIGPDRTAVEVYPAECDLVDQANMYHLWVLPPNFVLPFGLHKAEKRRRG